MPIGRISGPLLARNLFRDGVDIAFYDDDSTAPPVLYLDVTNTRVGIKKEPPLYTLDVGGTINGDVLRIIETTTGTGVGTIGKIFISTNTIYSVTGPVNIQPSGANDINLRANTTVYGSFHATGNITADGDIGLGNLPSDRLKITAELDSNIVPAIDNTYNLGSTSSAWQQAFLEEIYTRKIQSQTGSIEIKPANGLLEIDGQLRINSQKGPLGTAPVVSNILYVTTDGDDTNDGTAMDPTRACRTISGAVKSPYYYPGTSIKVAPGRYYEDNPILLRPYTSVIGSDLRTTFIEPINKTQDLFHVQSGCYIAQLQMSQGRSGLLPIENSNGYNRGAYCVAFPPLVDGRKLDVFRSPYVQNCTNESGPWLKDGTMFFPNQTVQIPRVVATGTWAVNTNTFNVYVSTGTIRVGDSINAGPQNLGFFDARTLILANKSFIQEQVINYISNRVASALPGSIWYQFDYLRAKCYRDVGIILENVSYDTTFGGNEKSVESGKAYYDGVISLIAGQELQTIEAINYINTLTQRVIANQAITPLGIVTNPQIFNDNLNRGSVAGPGFANNIKIITDIITFGTASAPPISKSAGPDAYLVSAEVLLQTNRAFIQNEITAYVDYNYSSINYNVEKCKRDVGLIVDSIALDLMYPTAEASQSTFAGLQYWDQSGYTGLIDKQLTTTTNAIAYLNYLTQEVIQNITTGARYAIGGTRQQIEVDHAIPPASTTEAELVDSLYDIIINIIQGGTIGVSNIIQPNGDPTTNPAIVNAYNNILANKTFMQDEVIAWVQSNASFGFTNPGLLNRCRVDTGYIIDSICFDLLHGGNKQSVQSGVYYYAFSTSTSAIIGTIPQTIYAFNTLTSLVKELIVNTTVTTSQSVITQNRSLTASDPAIGIILEGFMNKITNIVENGPSVADTKVPIRLTRESDVNRERAYRILMANREFLKEEVVARTNSVYFRLNTYNRDKCRRDTGLIVDAIVQDILFPTADNSQSTFAGLQYYNNTSTNLPLNQFTATIQAFTYAKSLCGKLVQNDGSNPRYSGSTQITGLPEATAGEASLIADKFDAFLDILQNGTVGVTDKIIPNSIVKDPNINVRQAWDILMANRSYIQDEVIAYVNNNNPPAGYDQNKCRRDTGYIVDSVAHDLLYGGNKQSIQCGVYYYGFLPGSSAIYQQTTATIAAYDRIRSIIPDIIRGIPVTPLQDQERQIYETRTSDTSTIAAAIGKIDVINYIIQNGPGVASPPAPISTATTLDTEMQKAAIAIFVNRQFIQAETIEYVNQTFALSYNRAKCSRDAGLIVDAITYDLIAGGNTKSREAAISYWEGTQTYIPGQIPQTVAAVERLRQIALQIASNTSVTRTTGNGTEQIINTYFANGGRATDYLNNNLNMIKSVMANGLSVAPQNYTGWGLFASTGISANDTKIAPIVRSVSLVSGNIYSIVIDRPTVGAAYNATLYFGDVLVFPKQDNEFTPQEALDWGQRMVDPTGAMGGALVDGSVVSERSPINSFVFDAFTQVSQGGRGIHIINNGYAQLVSVFTIFCSTHVEVTNGGIASITNSNANFGDYCLVAKGKGPLEFAGTVYNPPYPTLDQTAGRSDKGEYYPNGFWPNNAEVLVFISDLEVRPHIGLVMEVIPPKTVMVDTTGNRDFVEQNYVNEQGLPGFLNAAPDINLLTTGSIKISGIDTTGIAIGHTLYVRDQFGSFTNNLGTPYGDTGTVVTDVGFQSVTLNKALTAGGGEVDNPNFFTLLFCGNAYYNVLTSNTSTDVIPGNTTVLKSPAQFAAELDAILTLIPLLLNIISNNVVIARNLEGKVQDRNHSPALGATNFLSARLDEIVTILQSGINAAPGQRKTGTPPPDASNAVVLLQANKDFIVAEITQRVINAGIFVMDALQTYKCRRDTALIIDKLCQDLAIGGNYNSVQTGLSYYVRQGTHHVVSLEDQVRNPGLFPDGATVNFYQRSYMSALSYTFEYVGAGTNYGSLPQVGRADPVQSREVIQIDNGKVFFTSTDQNGDFRIGPGLVISQATGVLSGRTFTKSLFAQMTPFILAVEAGAAG